MVINSAHEELKKIQEANQEPEIIEIEYSDTKQTIRREALKLLKEWGYDEPPESNFIKMN